MDKIYQKFKKKNEEERLNVITKLKIKDKFKSQFKVWFSILIELIDHNPDNRL